MPDNRAPGNVPEERLDALRLLMPAPLPVKLPKMSASGLRNEPMKTLLVLLNATASG